MQKDDSLDFFIQMHLTERCNLRCLHCYQTGESPEELSRAEVTEAVQEIADTLAEWSEAYGIEYSPGFNVTGGEPFLRADILDILSEISSHGFKVFVLSNGILIDKGIAKSLSAAEVKGVQVSVEGPEKIHDSIRGEGSFTASLKGISNAVEAGLAVTLNMTLSKLNANYFEEMVGLSLSLGVQRLGFSRLVPRGKGRAMLDLMIASDELKEIYTRIFSLDTGNLDIVSGDPVASQFRKGIQEQDEGEVPLGGCSAGISGLTILADGSLVPCRRLPLPLGNIRSDSFREVWTASPVLQDLRDRSKYVEKCRFCRRWANCRGCRAIAFASSSVFGEPDFLAADPQCFME